MWFKRHTDFISHKKKKKKKVQLKRSRVEGKQVAREVGVKVDLSAVTSVGGSQSLCSKGPVNHSHSFNMRRFLVAPGIRPAIPLWPLYPQPEADKGLFT